jgi:hypothetical protein
MASCLHRRMTNGIALGRYAPRRLAHANRM